MKRIFTLLLAAALLLSVLAVPAGAYTGNETVPFTEFTDIYDLGEPYVSSIEYLDHHGLMTGTSDTTFSPYQPYTRAMFVTMLGRMENNNGYISESDMLADADRYQGPTGFSDVPQGRWDAPYVKWAAENGIVNGVGNGRFDPTGIITVEQFAVIAFRFLEAHGYEINWEEETDSGRDPVIYDFDEVSAYAEDAVSLLGYTGLLLTDPDTSLTEEPGIYVHPKHQLNRMEVAVLFAEFASFVAGTQTSRAMPWGIIESWVEK